jgi:integrase
MPKITKKFIENKLSRPSKGQIFYRDDLLRGFALRVTPHTVSFIVECRLLGRNRRIKIGEYPAVSLQAARLEGRRLLALMKAGKDPILEKEKQQVATITVREVLDAYLACRKLRPNSIRSFVQLFHRCIADWLEMPIAEITKDMVVARHRELTRTTRQGTSGKTQANMAMERFGILVNFAANNFEVDGVPIVRSNPVKKLSQLRAWHPKTRRQTIIPDHKLAAWYEATMSVSRSVVSDYLLLLLFTGLRRNEAATLRWSDIDFDGKALTVRAEIAKNKHEHRFPLSHFLFALLSKRRQEASHSVYVFPGWSGRHHMVDSSHLLEQISQRCGHRFMLHDLRRVFLTTAEKLDVPYYVLRKLANHVSKSDVTGGYIVVDVERLRPYAEKISVHLIGLLRMKAAEVAPYQSNEVHVLPDSGNIQAG